MEEVKESNGNKENGENIKGDEDIKGNNDIKSDEDIKDSGNTGSEDDDNEQISLRTIIRERATEEDMPLTKNITLKKIIGGDFLYTQFIRKQIWLILLITVFIVIYISTRYQCQQDLIRVDKLKKQLVDAQYRALSSSSELTQKSRESKVLEILHESNDSSLHIATQQPYIVNVPEGAE